MERWKMSKLKTLKDIVEYRAMPDYESYYNLDDEDEYNNYRGDKEKVVDVSILKQEAIKWLKSNSPYLNDCDGEWIKYFFNIREEDE